MEHGINTTSKKHSKLLNMDRKLPVQIPITSMQGGFIHVKFFIDGFINRAQGGSMSDDDFEIHFEPDPELKDALKTLEKAENDIF